MSTRVTDPHAPITRCCAEMAQYATVAVINGLTQLSHPCQVMAGCDDLRGTSRPDPRPHGGLGGDDNNVLSSWMQAAERFDFSLRVATPPELAPKKPMLDWIKSSGAAIKLVSDPEEAVKDADCVGCDTRVTDGRPR